jgi:hypothetical protein
MESRARTKLRTVVPKEEDWSRRRLKKYCGKLQMASGVEYAGVEMLGANS